MIVTLSFLEDILNKNTHELEIIVNKENNKEQKFYLFKRIFMIMSIILSIIFFYLFIEHPNIIEESNSLVYTSGLFLFLTVVISLFNTPISLYTHDNINELKEKIEEKEKEIQNSLKEKKDIYYNGIYLNHHHYQENINGFKYKNEIIAYNDLLIYLITNHTKSNLQQENSFINIK